MQNFYMSESAYFDGDTLTCPLLCCCLSYTFCIWVCNKDCWHTGWGPSWSWTGWIIKNNYLKVINKWLECSALTNQCDCDLNANFSSQETLLDAIVTHPLSLSLSSFPGICVTSSQENTFRKAKVSILSHLLQMSLSLNYMTCCVWRCLLVNIYLYGIFFALNRTAFRTYRSDNKTTWTKTAIQQLSF